MQKDKSDYSDVNEAIRDLAKLFRLITELPPLVFDSEVQEKLNRLNEMSLNVPEQRKDIQSLFFSSVHDLFAGNIPGIMQNYTYIKPHGYPGDYQIIDWIYTNKTATSGIDKLWDEFYHRQAATQAVRNRKNFFRNIFGNHCNQYPDGFSVLNIASGPGRDVAESITDLNCSAEGVAIHCVDSDRNSIAYAKEVVGNTPSRVTIHWEVANAFKLRTERKYEIVWSAGLFDYLDDRFAVALVRRMWKWTKDGGTMIFGNFHPSNPSRNYMEWCGNWHLIHRTESDLIALCVKAGIAKESVYIDKEPLGINIFCLVAKSDKHMSS